MGTGLKNLAVDFDLAYITAREQRTLSLYDTNDISSNIRNRRLSGVASAPRIRGTMSVHLKVRCS